MPDDVKDALTHEDHIRLTELLKQKAGMAISSDLVEHAGDACSLGGVGLDTEYGQWIQQVLADGDWLKTSAIASQRRARKRNRADIDFPALVEPLQMSCYDPIGLNSFGLRDGVIPDSISTSKKLWSLLAV